MSRQPMRGGEAVGLLFLVLAAAVVTVGVWLAWVVLTALAGDVRRVLP